MTTETQTSLLETRTSTMGCIVDAVDKLRMAKASKDAEAIEAARNEIQDWPIEVTVSHGFHAPGCMPKVPTEFRILLSTGGPAARITGTLGDNAEPDEAVLEVQSRGTPGPNSAVLPSSRKPFSPSPSNSASTEMSQLLHIGGVVWARSVAEDYPTAPVPWPPEADEAMARAQYFRNLRDHISAGDAEREAAAYIRMAQAAAVERNVARRLLLDRPEALSGYQRERLMGLAGVREEAA